MPELGITVKPGFMAEDKRNPILGVRVPQELIDQLDGVAKASGRDRSQVVREALETFLGNTPSGAIQSELHAVIKRMDDLEKKLTHP